MSIVSWGLGSGFIPGDTIAVGTESDPIGITLEEGLTVPISSTIVISLDTVNSGPLVDIISDAIDILTGCP